MRQILLCCGLIYLALGAEAQVLLAVSGSCAYSDGTPVPDVDIFLSTVFDDSTFFFTAVETDDEGEYTETISIPDGQVEGEISISAIGCNGVFDFVTLHWSLNETVLVHDFVWCEIVENSDSCFVLIIPSADPLTEVTTLYALSSALEPVSYQWSEGNTTQTIIPIDTGTYCVTITGGDGCTTSGCYVYLDGSEGCFVSISSGNGPFSDTLLVAVGLGAAPIEYVWSTGDTGQTLVVHQETTYCVTMTDANGCDASSCTYYFQVSGTTDNARGTMKLFPQPAVDGCHIEIPSPLAGKSQLTITDMNGHVVLEDGNLFIASTEDWLDVGGFSPGMYIVKLHSEQGSWLSKLIKQ